MDLAMISGVIRCQICGKPITVSRSFGPQLRTAVCTNPLCAHYGYPREVSAYTRVPGQPTSHGT